MSKRHLSKNAVLTTGGERMTILTNLSVDAVKEGKDDRARRYVSLARHIGMKTKAQMPEGFKYCKGCLLPMIPGDNCRVRLTGSKIVYTCSGCGQLWRMPYLKERIR